MNVFGLNHTRFLRPQFWLRGSCASLFLLLGSFASLSAADDEYDALVVPVEKGVLRLKVEVFDPATGVWSVHTLLELDGKAGEVKVRLPLGTPEDAVRVSTHESNPFPQGYRGRTNSFSVQRSANSGDVPMGGDAMFLAEDSGRGGETEVVESDIWKVVGDEMYFFNHQRGLQLFDLSEPTEPVLAASYRLPAVGEQMYVLEDGTVLLLTRAGWGRESAILALRREGESFVEVGSVPVDGYLIESRLVGDQLYAASYDYREEPVDLPDPEGNGEIGDEPRVLWWQSYAVLTQIDFSEPAAPVVRGSVEHAGYLSVATATSDYFLLAVAPENRWYENEVMVYDITTPAEGLVLAGKAKPSGRVMDKFKLQVNGESLAIISEVRNGNWRVSHTALETFDLTTTNASAADGVVDIFARQDMIDLGEGEQLFATRFAGDKAYVVTFFMIDPLWIVDLSDPTDLKITGELEIPGWSTYLYPMGDQLLAVGTEDRRVTVSLFDVSDDTAPALAARVYLGEEWSWTEGHYDEKAVSVLPEAGLVLVPYYSWADGEQETRVQIVEFAGDVLSLRGSIDHRVQPRRATLLKDHFVSLSARELFMVSALDLDAPEVVGSLEIAWSTDRLAMVSGDLLQFEQGNDWGWYGDNIDGVRATPLLEVDRLLSSLDLGEASIAGHYVDDAASLLYLMLDPSGQRNYPYYEEDEEENAGPVDMELRVFDYANPSAPVERSVVTFPVEADRLRQDMRAEVLLDGELLWVPELQPWFGWWGIDFRIAGDFWWPYGGYGKVAEAFAFDVSSPDEPVLLGSAVLSDNSKDRGWPQEIFVAGDYVLAGFDSGWWDETERVYMRERALLVADFSDPEQPFVHPAYDLPGRLKGIMPMGDSGAIVLTLNDILEKNDNSSHDYFSVGLTLAASAFDGTDVFLLDEIEVGFEAASGLVVEGSSIYFAEWRESAEPANAHRSVWETALRRIDWSVENGLEANGERVFDDYINEVHIAEGLIMASRWDRLDVLAIEEWETGGNFTSYESKGPGISGLKHSVVRAGEGIWLPADIYGVEFIDWADEFGGLGRRLVAFDEVPAAEASLGARWEAVPDEVLEIVPSDESGRLGKLRERDWIFRPSGYQRPLQAVEDLGDGWNRSAWFGEYRDLEYPWIFHREHGWIYPLAESGAGIFAYDMGHGWMWTKDALYPFFYRFGDGTWAQYLEGSGLDGERWFFIYGEDNSGWESSGLSGF